MSGTHERIAALLREGRKLEAIKLLRQSTGIGLKEANEEIDRLMQGVSRAQPVQDDVGPIGVTGLPLDVEELALGGRKIEAIKRLRDVRGLGLKEARDQVEAATGSAGKGCTPRAAALVLVALCGVYLMFF